LYSFKDAVNGSDLIAFNNRIVVNNELGRIWKQGVVAEFEMLFRLLSGENEGKKTNTSARISVSAPKFKPGTFRIQIKSVTTRVILGDAA
jgi:hypothetical protein